MAGRMGEPLRAVVGAPTAKAFADHLGLRTVGELLRHYPRDYRRRGQLTDLRSLELDEHVTVLAEVVSLTHRPMRQRSGWVVDVVVTDGASRLRLTFFPRHRGALAHLLREMVVGRQGLFSGRVGVYRDVLQLVHPEHHFLEASVDTPDAGPASGASVGRAAGAPGGEAAGAVGGRAAGEAEGAVMDAFLGSVLPIYPAAQGVQSWTVAKAVRLVLDTLGPDDAPDPLPRAVLAARGFPGLVEALRQAHLPDRDGDQDLALDRLRYEEAFVLQAELARRRRSTAALPAVPRPTRSEGLLEAFDARLPFTLTPGQVQVGEQIAADLARPHPMHRLLQGEVGSGKTVVALRAMLAVVDAGGQAALLAPTEVLAAQHHRSLVGMLGDLAEGGLLGGADQATRVVLLTGSQGARARREALLEAAGGSAGIVVGTHALLQEAVSFADLGLVVVDEQHRFGVEQRDALRAKASSTPHLLVMTATPIPRTVAMTSFGDLETSSLVGLPSGRSPVATHVVPVDRPAWVARVWQRVREQVEAGRRVYVVCPSIGDDDPAGGDAGPAAGPDDDPGDATGDATGDAIGDGLLPVDVGPDGGAGGGPGGARRGSPRTGGRGRSGAADPDERPLASATATLAALAAEPVLAGVRLGLLHGRLPADEKDAVMRAFAAGEVDVLVATTVVEVGVDVPEATVMVVLDADRFGISQLHQLRGRVGRGAGASTCFLVTAVAEASPAMGRLRVVESTTDGFVLAQADLEARGEGDVLGARQSGARSSLRLLRVTRDGGVIEAARADAVAVVDDDPDLSRHPDLEATIGELLRPQHEDFLERG